MINAGALMVCALLVKQNKTVKDIIEFYKKITGNDYIVNMINYR